jgi:hypothetical protein
MHSPDLWWWYSNKASQRIVPLVSWLLLNFSTLYITGGFITKGIQVLADMMLCCWVSSSSYVEGKYKLYCQDEENLPYTTPPHDIFWLFFSVLLKTTVSYGMSPLTHSTTQHYIQEPHCCTTSNHIHNNIDSVFPIPTGSIFITVSFDESENYFSILPSKFCMHFSPCSSHQLTLCANSVPLSSSVLSLVLLDDSWSSSWSGPDGPSLNIWACIPDGHST